MQQRTFASIRGKESIKASSYLTRDKNITSEFEVLHVFGVRTRN